MKGLVIFLIYVGFRICLFGQGYGDVDFENNQFENTSFIFDSSSSWIIGSPSKVLFDSAYSKPNAIYTDSSQYYRVNDTSSFILSIKNWFNSGWRFEGIPFIHFHHIFDTEPNKDGGFIQISYDNGATWNNVIKDSIFNSNPNPGVFHASFHNFYTNNDTLYNGELAFSGNSNGWQHTTIRGDGCWYNWFMDSILFKFVFISDSVQTSNEGWLIDNIRFGATLCTTIEENEKTVFKYYPNPLTNELTMEFYKADEYYVEVVNVEGKKLKELTFEGNTKSIDFSGLTADYYFVRVSSTSFSKAFKVYKK